MIPLTRWAWGEIAVRAAQIGAAVMALGAGIVRDQLHAYDAAWFTGGALCVLAGALSLMIKRERHSGVDLSPESAVRATRDGS